MKGWVCNPPVVDGIILIGRGIAGRPLCTVQMKAVNVSVGNTRYLVTDVDLCIIWSMREDHFQTDQKEAHMQALAASGYIHWLLNATTVICT